jgi:hypothetical protein
MKKDIKDYLHLYLGCEYQYRYNDSAEWRPSQIRLSIKVLSDHPYRWEIKPILRPLSDMTEEEAIKYLRLKHNAYSGEYEIKLRDNGFWWLFKTIASDERFKFFGEMLDESNSDQFRWLLSKGFDLFGLIEAGLAIDKTKLPTPV